MQLTKATIADLDNIMAILSDGRDQLAEKGVDPVAGGLPFR